MNKIITANGYVNLYEFWVKNDKMTLLLENIPHLFASPDILQFFNHVVKIMKPAGCVRYLYAHYELWPTKFTFGIGLHDIIFTCIKRGQLPVFIQQ